MVVTGARIRVEWDCTRWSRFLFRHGCLIGGTVVGWKRAMPRDNCRREPGSLGRLGGDKVVFLRCIGGEIVELRGSSVIGAEEFPMAFADGEIREIVIASE